MGYPCRCFARINGKTCFARRTLARKPAEYLRPPKCSCGNAQWHIDTWRTKHEVWGRGDTCHCGGYHFMHRKGSKMCYHHPNAEEHHTERWSKATE